MVGVLVALYAVFPLLLAVYAGRISDRIGVRYPILLGSVGITGHSPSRRCTKACSPCFCARR